MSPVAPTGRKPVIVMHCHRPIGPDLPLMRAGGVTCKVYQVDVDVEIGPGYLDSTTRFAGWTRRVLALFEAARQEIDAHASAPAPGCRLALTAADIQQAADAGHTAILLGIEGAKLLEADLTLLAAFHRLGLRELQLTWAVPNQLVPDGSLSPFGAKVVAECGRLGIIVDVTHIPDPAFAQVIAVAKQPVIVSHGSAAAVRTDQTDQRIRALAGTGGMVGIHFYSSYLGSPPTLDAVVANIDHIAGLVGIDHVGLGVDFFPTHGVWGDFQRAQGTTDISWAIPDMSQMPRVAEALARRGYKQDDVDKVMGLNYLRVCRVVFGA